MISKARIYCTAVRWQQVRASVVSVVRDIKILHLTTFLTNFVSGMVSGKFKKPLLSYGKRDYLSIAQQLALHAAAHGYTLPIADGIVSDF